MFKEMSMNFPNLKGITFSQTSFYGSITTKSFDGLENLERVTFKHTNVDSIEDGAFENLKNIKGNLSRILTLWSTATTHYTLISYSSINYFLYSSFYRNINYNQWNAEHININSIFQHQ